MLQIFADENIPEAIEYFSEFGKVHLFSGRHLKSADLENADILLVRSVTKVNRELLEGTPVRFVGTATAGTNHIDGDALQELGITWCSAPGSNARSVAEYLLACLLQIDPQIQLENMQLGVIGLGHVGKEVKKLFSPLVAKIVSYDPFLNPKSDETLSSLEEVKASDILTFHVPLTKTGPYPTLNWVGERFFEKREHLPILVNSCRGEVFIEKEIQMLQAQGRIGTLISDVYWGEPNPDRNYLEGCTIHTPHIAGYSYTGKIRGVTQLCAALSRFLKTDREEYSQTSTSKSKIRVQWAGSWQKQVLAAYNPLEDHGCLAESNESFDYHRKNYPQRLEFNSFEVLDVPSAQRDLLTKIGFFCLN